MPTHRIHLPALGTGLFAVLLLLSGCATMNEKECRSANWYSIGFEDGAKGRPVGYIGRHREACAEYGISPNAQGYQEGWDKGLRRYCTPPNGYRAGLHGQSVSVQCPPEQRAAFHEAYAYGKRIHLAEADLDALEREMSTQQRELESLRQEMEQVDHELVSGGDGGYRRVHDQLRRLYRRESELKAKLSALAGKGKPREGRPEKGGPGKEQASEQRGLFESLGKIARSGGEKDNDKKNDKNKDNDDKSKDKQRKALQKELAKVRQNIHALESRLDRDERKRRWQLLQRSKALAQQEGALLADLFALEREQAELEQHILWLKRRSPY
jgi:hypothetical protein